MCGGGGRLEGGSEAGGQGMGFLSSLTPFLLPLLLLLPFPIFLCLTFTPSRRKRKSKAGWQVGQSARDEATGARERRIEQGREDERGATARERGSRRERERG